MTQKVFKLESGSVNYDLSIIDGEISVSMIRKLKSCRIEQVTKIIQKHTSLGGGDEMSFRIIFNDHGKEGKFPWIPVRVTAASTKECFEYLKEILPSTVEWTDQRAEKSTDAEGRKIYDLQFLPFGYAGSGLPRGLQLWIYMIGLGVLIIPLILIAKILATGGYRIYTNSEGIEIKKLGSKKWTWSDIDDVNLTNVNVVDSNSYSSTQVMKMAIKNKTGKTAKVIMRYDHAVPLLKEMAEHNLVSQEIISKFS